MDERSRGEQRWRQNGRYDRLWHTARAIRMNGFMPCDRRHIGRPVGPRALECGRREPGLTRPGLAYPVAPGLGLTARGHTACAATRVWVVRRFLPKPAVPNRNDELATWNRTCPHLALFCPMLRSSACEQQPIYKRVAAPQCERPDETIYRKLTLRISLGEKRWLLAVSAAKGYDARKGRGRNGVHRGETNLEGRFC